MQTDNDGMCLNSLYVNLVGSPQLLKNLGKEAKIGHRLVMFHSILIEGGFLQ